MQTEGEGSKSSKKKKVMMEAYVRNETIESGATVKPIAGEMMQHTE